VIRGALLALAMLASALATPAQAGTPPPASLHQIKWFVHTDLVDGTTPLPDYEALLEAALDDARLLLEGSQGPADTVCCQKLVAEDHGGAVSLATFGAPLDGLDHVGPGDFALLETLGGSGSRGFIVQDISDCQGTGPAIGCATMPACSAAQPPDDDPNVIVVVSLEAESLGVTGLVIAHERGHNACLAHVAEPVGESCALMREAGSGGCLSASECMAYANARQQTGGVCACHDGPLQEVDGLSCTDGPVAGLCSGGICGATNGDAGLALLSAGGPEGPTGGVTNDPLRLSGVTGGWTDRGWVKDIKGMEYDLDGETLYGVEDAEGDDLLVTLDPTNGTKQATVGPITGAADVIALAFDPGPTPAPGDDRLLALSSVGGFEDLLALDPQTGAPTFLGSLAIGVAGGFQGLAYDDLHDRLYASGFAGSGLFEIDLASCPWFCDVLEVTSVSLPRESSSLAFSRMTGRLYLVGAGSLGRTLYDSIHAATLTADTSIGIDAYTPGGLAAIPVPEPDPRTALVAGAALLAWFGRRRSATRPARHLPPLPEHSMARTRVRPRRAPAGHARVETGRCPGC
jgi:hypothetical protein